MSLYIYLVDGSQWQEEELTVQGERKRDKDRERQEQSLFWRCELVGRNLHVLRRCSRQGAVRRMDGKGGEGFGLGGKKGRNVEGGKGRLGWVETRWVCSLMASGRCRQQLALPFLLTAQYCTGNWTGLAGYREGRRWWDREDWFNLMIFFFFFFFFFFFVVFSFFCVSLLFIVFKKKYIVIFALFFLLIASRMCWKGKSYILKN